jgi:hypothetical protein
MPSHNYSEQTFTCQDKKILLPLKVHEYPAPSFLGLHQAAVTDAAFFFLQVVKYAPFRLSLVRTVGDLDNVGVVLFGFLQDAFDLLFEIGNRRLKDKL